MKKNIAVLSSGNGTNAQKIFEYFKLNTNINVKICITNKENAGVISKANNHNINTLYISNQSIEKGNELLNVLKKNNIHLIVLAGFLRKIPKIIIDSFENKIVNIHPSLLPKYGGKGMYGIKVHEAVKKNGEEYSGTTIHLVNEKFDDGKILAQFQVRLDKNDSSQQIQNKVLNIEHKYYSKIIEAYLEEI